MTSETARIPPVGGNRVSRDGLVYYWPDVVADPQKELEALLEETAWRQDHARIMGRKIPLPRLTAWYGDIGYRYSGIDNPPRPWTPRLQLLRELAEALAEQPFNSVLLNLYRNGSDGMGWHSDDERSLGRDPVIVSLSLGAARRFDLKHREAPGIVAEIELESGSALLMGGSLQHHWRHSLPKTKKVVGPRINLTFRAVLVR